MALSLASVSMAASFGTANGVLHEKVGGTKFGRHVGKLEARALELADSLAELLAACRPFGGKPQQPLRLAAAGGAHEDAAIGQPLSGQLQAAAFLAKHLAGTQPHIVEAQLESLVAAVAHAMRAVAHVKARRSGIDQEGRYPLARSARGLVDTGCCEDDGEIRQHRA
jgi:hypothetical protein